MTPAVFGLTIMAATLTIGFAAIWATETIMRRINKETR